MLRTETDKILEQISEFGYCNASIDALDDIVLIINLVGDNPVDPDLGFNFNRDLKEKFIESIKILLASDVKIQFLKYLNNLISYNNYYERVLSLGDKWEEKYQDQWDDLNNIKIKLDIQRDDFVRDFSKLKVSATIDAIKKSLASSSTTFSSSVSRECKSNESTTDPVPHTALPAGSELNSKSSAAPSTLGVFSSSNPLESPFGDFSRSTIPGGKLARTSI